MRVHSPNSSISTEKPLWVYWFKALTLITGFILCGMTKTHQPFLWLIGCILIGYIPIIHYNNKIKKLIKNSTEETPGEN
jgi:thiosulfate reductase cytochrome b subunit